MGNAALIDPGPWSLRSYEADGATRERLTVLVQAAIGVEGAALAVLVGRDGTPSWQVLRVVAVAVTTIGTGWFVGRSGRVGLALCALVTGVIGTVAGAGIGAMHLVKGAVTPAWIAGLGCLAAGIVREFASWSQRASSRECRPTSARTRAAQPGGSRAPSM